ncbi:hypothetical protein BDD12DRAFT_221402 [Trichophaea hybrida]|nr:hypothetical protein BDD12DRAFT_221402 [Trichophaea hybrida]
MRLVLHFFATYYRYSSTLGWSQHAHHKRRAGNARKKERTGSCERRSHAVASPLLGSNESTTPAHKSLDGLPAFSSFPGVVLSRLVFRLTLPPSTFQPLPINLTFLTSTSHYCHLWPISDSFFVPPLLVHHYSFPHPICSFVLFLLSVVRDIDYS